MWPIVYTNPTFIRLCQGCHYSDHGPPLAKDTAVVSYEKSTKSKLFPWPSVFRPPLPCLTSLWEAPFTLASLLFLEHFRFVPALGHSHRLFPLRLHILLAIQIKAWMSPPLALPYHAIWSGSIVTLHHLILFYVWYFIVNSYADLWFSFPQWNVDFKKALTYLSWSPLCIQALNLAKRGLQ